MNLLSENGITPRISMGRNIRLSPEEILNNSNSEGKSALIFSATLNPSEKTLSPPVPWAWLMQWRNWTPGV